MYNLKDFPDYRIDITTGRVYSYRTKGKEREIRGFAAGNKGSQLKYQVITTDGRVFNASIGRLIAAAQYGCSYFKLPKDVMFNWTPEGGRQPEHAAPAPQKPLPRRRTAQAAPRGKYKRGGK